MIGAIVKFNVVTSLIVIKAEEKTELEAALDCEIVDARPYGLIVGDMRTAKGWTRNAGGEQIVLALQDQKAYDGYSLAVERAIDAETALASADEAAADEAISILSGEVSA